MLNEYQEKLQMDLGSNFWDLSKKPQANEHYAID